MGLAKFQEISERNFLVLISFKKVVQKFNKQIVQILVFAPGVWGLNWQIIFVQSKKY